MSFCGETLAGGWVPRVEEDCVSMTKKQALLISMRHDIVSRFLELLIELEMRKDFVDSMTKK